MAQVLITSDDGRILFDGTINLQHAYDLAELVKEEFMAKEWMDVPEEELGLETDEAIEQVREEPGHREVPKGFPVMQRRRLISAIERLAKVEKKLEIEDWDDGSCAKDKRRKVYPGDDKGNKNA
jgi:hypothetical protein